MSQIRKRRLEDAVNGKKPFDVYLQNGVRLSGKVIEFDDSCLVLDSAKCDWILVEFSSMASFQPSTPVAARQ